MPLDPSIAMGVQVPNTADPVNKYVDSQRAGQANDAENQQRVAQAHLAAAEAFKSHLEGLSAQEQMKLHAQVAGAAGLSPFLDKGDIQGATNYIQNMPFNVDAQTKQQALGMLQSGDPKDLEQLKHYTNSLKMAGQVYGILPDTTFAQYQNMDPQGQKEYGNYKMASFGGRSPAMAELMMMNNDPTTANLPLAQKLQIVNHKLGTNMTVDASGQVQDMSGAAAASGNLAAGAKGGAEGAVYQKQLTTDATAATTQKQMLGEASQLLNGFTPGNFTPLKQKIGEYLISAGVDPNAVNSALGDVGDMQALGKLTAQFAAQSLRSFTSRGTQMEFNTFVQNNPNSIGTTQGMQKIIGFLGKMSDTKIQKQQQFQDWTKQGNSVGNYGNFESQWNQDLNQGPDQQMNSFQNKGAPPAEGARQAPDGNWYVSDPNRKGKYLRVDQ